MLVLGVTVECTRTLSLFDSVVFKRIPKHGCHLKTYTRTETKAVTDEN